MLAAEAIELSKIASSQVQFLSGFSPDGLFMVAKESPCSSCRLTSLSFSSSSLSMLKYRPRIEGREIKVGKYPGSREGSFPNSLSCKELGKGKSGEKDIAN